MGSLDFFGCFIILTRFCVTSGDEGQRFQVDIHTLDGTDNPMTPLFTWHGFQYVQVHLDSGAEIDFAKAGQGFTGLVAGMKLEDSLVNRSLVGGDDVAVMNGVFELARRSQRSNLAGERIAHIHPGPLLTSVCVRAWVQLDFLPIAQREKSMAGSATH